MNVFIQGKIKGTKTRIPVTVNEEGVLLATFDNGTPAFLNFTATTEPTALPDKPGRQVAIKNLSGGAMTIGRINDEATWTLPDGTERTFVVAKSSAELLVSVASGEYNLDAEVWG